MLSKAIYSLLSNDATVSGLLGTKIYPERTPETISQPFCIFSYYERPTDTKDGVSILDVYDVYVTHYALSFQTGEEIHEAIRDVLDRYAGTVAGVTIDEFWYVDRENNYVDDAELYQFNCEYKVRVKR